MGKYVSDEARRTYAEEGVVRLPGVLDDNVLSLLQQCFDYCFSNPGPQRNDWAKESENLNVGDYLNPDRRAYFHEHVPGLPFADILKEL
jgi:hypothetical protein